jgi:hypothetical protein
MPLRPVNLVFLGLLAALAAQLVHAAVVLPERVASHFDLRGNADSWMQRSSFLAVLAAVIALVALMFGGLRALLPHLPDSLINMPNRDYWLTPERRAATLRRSADALTWIGSATLALFVAILWITVDANFGGEPVAIGSAGWVAVGVYLAVVAAISLRMLRAFRLPRGRSPGDAT